MNQQIDSSLAGGDDGSRQAYARPKSKLGELTKHKDLPRSENDANQPFYLLKKDPIAYQQSTIDRFYQFSHQNNRIIVGNV